MSPTCALQLRATHVCAVPLSDGVACFPSGGSLCIESASLWIAPEGDVGSGLGYGIHGRRAAISTVSWSEVSGGAAAVNGWWAVGPEKRDLWWAGRATAHALPGWESNKTSDEVEEERRTRRGGSRAALVTVADREPPRVSTSVSLQTSSSASSHVGQSGGRKAASWSAALSGVRSPRLVHTRTISPIAHAYAGTPPRGSLLPRGHARRPPIPHCFAAVVRQPEKRMSKTCP